MNTHILKAENIFVSYHSNSEVSAVHNVSLLLKPGCNTGLIGESGSGKSSFALALMGMLREQASVKGTIFYEETPLHSLSETGWNDLRWNDIALVFQNSLDVLNPVLTIGEQIAECMVRHSALSPKDRVDKVEGLLDMVGLGRQWKTAYPHQLSGGMRQKVLIAMALSCDPRVLIVDEPTMALDASAKQQIVNLLLDLQQQDHFAMLVISHELQIIRRMTSDVMVMYAGSIMEEGVTREVLNDPMHPYTRGLVYSSPSVNPFRDMWGIPGNAEEPSPGECPFYSRCSQRVSECRKKHPSLEPVGEGRKVACARGGPVGEGRKVACARGGIVTLLQGEDLHKSYHVKKRVVPACRGCSLRVKSGEVAALIGESGSGKTTMGELLSGALAPDRGRIRFEGREVIGTSETSKQGGIQIVFQDPLSATNGRLSIGEVVREPLDILREGAKAERTEAVRAVMKHVMLPVSDEFLARPCRTLSGGQRQRVAIARGLVMKPKLLIADEISAMLDPSTGANILRLLKGLQNEYGFAMLFITHDLAMARKISDRVFVMHEGCIIEHGTISEVFTSPKKNYTQRLLANAKLEGGNEVL